MSKKDGNNKKSFIKPLKVHAEIEVEYFAISKETLKQLREYSDDSTSFDLSLFFFSLSIGLILTIITARIENFILFISLLVVSTLLFAAGIFKYLTYKKSKKSIDELLKKIENQKCLLK